MTEKRLPNWLSRQKILHSIDKKGSPKDLSALGERALAEGSPTDALEYFRVAGDDAGITKIESLAWNEGDSFLLGAVERLGRKVEEDVWNRTGERALELGKLRFAKAAFARTKNEAMLSKVNQLEGAVHDSPPPGAADTPSV